MQGNPPVWDKEEIFTSGDAYFETLGLEISRARTSVDLETYIFERDELGLRVLFWLEQAVERGVKVRLMIDGVGSSSWGHADLKALNDAGIETHVFHPLPWQVSDSVFRRSLNRSEVRLRISLLNRRNHRKTCIIDGKVAFIGGINVSASHLAAVMGEIAWRDSAVRVEGPDVKWLTQAFDSAWYSQQPARCGSPIVRLNHGRGARRRLYRQLIMRMVQARLRIWITVPYFSPELSLLRALRFASWSGADVRILLPHRNDVWIMRWVNKAFYAFLLGAGVRIFEYRASTLHAKTMLIDDWAVLGSSNLNHRSLIHDLEADIVLTQRASIDGLAAQFLADLKNSNEIRLASWKRRGWLHQWMEWLSLKLRHWV